MPIRNRLLRLVLLLLLGVANTSASAEINPFVTGSLEQITDARAGERLLVVLWSIDCPPCMKELGLIQALHSTIDSRNLILVSTDGTENRREVEETLAGFGLEGVENWIFADDMPERLRYQIDPNWFGELPRAYFYDTDHQRLGVSGALSRDLLEQWLGQPNGTQSH